MKKAVLSLCTLLILLCASLFSLPSARADSLSRAETAQIKAGLMMLWNLGYTDIGPDRHMDQENLLRASLYYRLLLEDEDCCAFRWNKPQLFESMPENWTAFISRDVVAETASRIFGGQLDASQGGEWIIVTPEGYYLDFASFLQSRITDEYQQESMVLPGYTEISSLRCDKGIFLLEGKVRRFKEIDDGSEILWGAASFTLQLVRTEAGLAVKSLSMQEEGMG